MHVVKANYMILYVFTGGPGHYVYKSLKRERNKYENPTVSLSLISFNSTGTKKKMYAPFLLYIQKTHSERFKQ